MRKRGGQMLPRLFRPALQAGQPGQACFDSGIALAELFHFLKRGGCAFVIAQLKTGVAEQRVGFTLLRTPSHQFLRVRARRGEFVIGKLGSRERAQPARILPRSHRGERSPRRR